MAKRRAKDVEEHQRLPGAHAVALARAHFEHDRKTYFLDARLGSHEVVTTALGLAHSGEGLATAVILEGATEALCAAPPERVKPRLFVRLQLAAPLSALALLTVSLVPPRHDVAPEGAQDRARRAAPRAGRRAREARRGPGARRGDRPRSHQTAGRGRAARSSWSAPISRPCAPPLSPRRSSRRAAKSRVSAK